MSTRNDAPRTVSECQYPQQIIEATKASAILDFRSVWRYRGLLWMFIVRDLTVQYKQTVIGLAWAVIKPVITISIFTLVFGLLARLPSGGYPYHIFLFSAVVVFQYFSKAVTEISGCLVNKKALLTQIYFPRILVPLTLIVVGLVDLVIGLLVFAVLLIWSGITPTWHVVTLPFFLFIAIFTALGVGSWLCAIDVSRRDVRQVMPNIIMFWMYATPIIYPLSIVPSSLQMLYGLNPMATVVGGFRWALLDNWPAPPTSHIVISVLVATICFFVGIQQFNTVEKTMADYA